MRHLSRTLAAIALLACSGCTGNLSPDQMAIQARQRAAQEPKPPSPEALAMTQKLTEEYREILAAAFPNYNGIRVEVSYGDLMARHPLFTSYEFDAGPFGPTVYQWIAENRSKFAIAGIRRVSVHPDNGHPVWYNTQVAAPSAPNSGDVSIFPLATAVAGKPGYVLSPYTGGLVDVRSLASGQKAKCPYTGRTFIVP